MSHKGVGVVVGRDEVCVRAVRIWAKSHAGIVAAEHCVHLLCGAMVRVPVLPGPGLSLGVGPWFGFAITLAGAGLIFVVVIVVRVENCGQLGGGGCCFGWCCFPVWR